MRSEFFPSDLEDASVIIQAYEYNWGLALSAWHPESKTPFFEVLLDVDDVGELTVKVRRDEYDARNSADVDYETVHRVCNIANDEELMKTKNVEDYPDN